MVNFKLGNKNQTVVMINTSRAYGKEKLRVPRRIEHPLGVRRSMVRFPLGLSEVENLPCSFIYLENEKGKRNIFLRQSQCSCFSLHLFTCLIINWLCSVV